MAKLNTYVALLRGINVGGKSLVSMDDLKVCFRKLGLENVRTYINSGNVIFTTTEQDTRKLEAKIEKGLEASLKMPLTVVVRSQQEITDLLNNLPQSWKNPKDKKCNVIFLRHTIDSPSLIAGLNPKLGIEELYYYPGALLWSADTSDLTQSNMVKLSRNKIYKEMTVRNLNTVRKIGEMMGINI